MTEAKYWNMSNATFEVIWLLALLKNSHINLSSLAVLFCDNKSALHIPANPVFHYMTKHIDIYYHERSYNKESSKHYTFLP